MAFRNLLVLLFGNLLLLLLACVHFQRLSLAQHICKERGCQMPLVFRFVLGHHHALPLLRGNAPGLHFLSVDGRHTLGLTLLGLVHGHPLDTVQVDVLRLGAEQVHLQGRLHFRQCVVFMRQLHADLLDVVHRLLERGEETVHIFLVRIDAVTFLVLRLDVERPTPFVVRNHLRTGYVHIVRPSDRRGYVQRGERLHCPVLQPGQCHLLLGEVAVVGPVSQSAVGVEEAHALDALSPQDPADTCLVHARYLVVRIK